MPESPGSLEEVTERSENDCSASADILMPGLLAWSRKSRLIVGVGMGSKSTWAVRCSIALASSVAPIAAFGVLVTLTFVAVSVEPGTAVAQPVTAEGLRWDGEYFGSRLYGKVESKALEEGTITIDYVISAAGFREVSRNFYNASHEATTWIIVLDYAFDSAQKLFKDNPSAKEIVWNWVNPQIQRDEYGNLITPMKYSTVAKATLSRAKSEKLNWNFIKAQAWKGYSMEHQKYLSTARASVPKALPAF